jgi:hypothetical protein
METINYPELEVMDEEIINFNEQQNIINNISQQIIQQINNLNMFQPKLKGYQIRDYNGQIQYFEISNQDFDMNQIKFHLIQNHKPQKFSFYFENLNTDDLDNKQYMCQLRYNSESDSFYYENFWNHNIDEFNKLKDRVNDYFQINF